MHVLKVPVVLPLTLALVLAHPHQAFAEGENPSHSSAESIKRKLFIKKVFPMPAVFEWNKHEVTFKECWVERPAPGGNHNLLCFRLLLNQSSTEEMEVQKRSNRSIELREVGSKAKTLLSGTHVNYPWRNFKLKKIRNGIGELMHWIEIKEPETKRVSMQIYTMNHDTDRSEKTDVILTFDDLQEQK